MKPEVSERLFIEALFEKSKAKLENKELELSHVERLTGDASTRRYYRLEAGSDSFVACLDNPSDSNTNSFVRMQEFLNAHDIRVPRLYDIKLRKGYLLEEDLGDITLLQHLSHLENREEEYNIYEKVINTLLSMHKIPVEEINKKKIFSNSFDAKKLNSEIHFTTDFFIKRFLNVTDAGVAKDIEKMFEPICDRSSSEKMVFTHRDFHSRNLMLKNGEHIVIDFQDARWGIPQYDLVSILEDCYYELSRENKYKLKKYYFENLAADIHGQGDFDNFCEIYDDMALQRVFKAIGSFSYIYETRKDIRYVKYIGFAMEKMKLMLFKHDRYSDLRKLLFKYYYES